ncbi:MAG: S41 family peptidase [Patescibacteria group bacterium]
MFKFKINKKYYQIGIFIVILAIIGVGAFYYGYDYGYQEGVEKPKTLIIRGVANLEKDKPEEVNFDVFWEAWQVLKDKYVGADKLKAQDLVYGAVSGLVDSLNDPHSVFMPPTDAKKFSEDISGEFSGVGMEIGIRNNQLVVISPLKGTPAEKAGILAGDKILEVNSTSTEGLSVDEAVKLIRGPKGTKVILTIMRDSFEKPKEIEVIRDVIQVPTLDFEMLALREAKGKDIAYFHLYNFYENAPSLFYQSAIKAALSSPKGIIFDLRNNPGGYLEASVNIAGWFLNRGDLVVSEEFASGQKQEFKAYGSGFFRNTPMVVLINEGSASASEILAGALKDNKKVKLIGKKSFGKGTVQELASLRDGSQIKITTAHWLMPKGQLIEKNGITPDYEVEITEEDLKNKKDPQLEKAIEILKQEIDK